ncbi:MAG: dethiobiotin synthase [Nitrospirales bacterium]|nr:MAG: dethiobiotin synthase [Nitrospirales bacterium]
MTNQSIFITGTDTGVGKTTMTAALTLALQEQGHAVGILKPFETGVNVEHLEHSDTERLRHLLSPPPAFDKVCMYAFPQPLAPLAAAREVGTTINFSRIHSQIHTLTQQYAFLLIEGAGGLFTPITPRHTMRDLIALLKIPCLIVGHTDLGSVNHCLLTMEALQHAGIPVSGIVLNESRSQNPNPFAHKQRESSVQLIREWSLAPVFGPIGFTQTVETRWREGVNTLSEDSEIQRLATHLTESGKDSR